MLPRERVLEALSFREPDRTPIYVWVFNQPGVIDDIRAKYGTFEAFCDALDLDMTQAFPAKGVLKRRPQPGSEHALRDATYGWVYTIEAALEAELNDPDEEAIYQPIRAEIEHHKGRRGRAVFAQTPGVFEAANGFIGLEQNLLEMAFRPELCQQLYERIARWSARYAENCLELGVDVIHVSDDWGMNHALLFRPQSWWELIFPAEKIICDAVRKKGGLLLLSIDGADQSFWLPLFTHVEDVMSVLKGIEQILSDTPDAKASALLSNLRQRADALQRAGRDAPPLRHPSTLNPQPSHNAWRALFEEVSALRDALLLRRINFDTLLFVKRKPFFSEQPFMDAHHLFNRPGGGIYRLSPVRPDGKVTPVVDSLGEGVYRDVCLHWDAKKILFSFGNGNDKWDGKQSYHLYEIGVDGKGLRQLTFGAKNDCEPFYLPNGQIGFTSDRSEHFVMCGGDRHVANLFVMDDPHPRPLSHAAGEGRRLRQTMSVSPLPQRGRGVGGEGNVRQLSFNVFNDFNPTVLPDGRILYSRWEYNERSVTSLHKLFTINPDGTQMSPYYGNATIRPNVIMFARPVPNSGKVMALFTAHHGQTHGAIGLIDVSKGMDGDAPITVLTPGVPVTGEKAEDSKHGWFSDPMPLSETTYLCSFTPTVLPWLERSWAIYVGDRHGNLALIYRDPEISCAEPVPLVTRPRPHVLPPAKPHSDATDAEATVLLMNVYQNLPGVPRGAAKYLRVLEDVPRKGVGTGGVIVTAATGIYTVKRIFGVVPIEPDGSAHFVVPANRNVYFEVLDEKQQEIQRMRSVVCLKPGERRTCVGCHESRTTAPPNISFSAASRPPSRPIPPPWGRQTISFLRDVQPVLNAKCVRCHAYDRWRNGVVLTDDLTDQFTISYQELLPYLSTANAMRWDHPEDVYPRPPFTYGSKVSCLTKLLEAGHHGVQLTNEEWQRLVNWIDANGVYYDRYESAYGDRHIFTGNVRKAMNDVYARRCARCHGQDNDGRDDTWWLSLNRREVKQSRALQAPLARSAGGWERCEETVFASTDDADYKMLLASLTSLRDQLTQRPREDLLSLQGTDAERQEVALPPPPTKTLGRDGDSALRGERRLGLPQRPALGIRPLRLDAESRRLAAP